jgi:hypothetical protein
MTSGGPLGPLHGVPTATKDLFDFKPGWPATMGGVRVFKDLSIPALRWIDEGYRLTALDVAEAHGLS